MRSKATLILAFLLVSKLFLGCENINSNNIWTNIEPLPLDPDIEKKTYDFVFVNYFHDGVYNPFQFTFIYNASGCD